MAPAGRSGLAMSPVTGAGDGRHLRREQNRDAVIDALLALFREGNYQPGSAEIALKAGLSPRSLFRYFDDVDDLHRAAAHRQIALVLPLLELHVSPDATTAQKVGHLVQARVRLYEQIGPAGRALRACARRHGQLADELHRSRDFLRGQLSEVFAAELAAGHDGLLPVLDVLCSLESYELLRHAQGMSASSAAAALTAALTMLLSQAGDAVAS